jgi:hypothetical protein
MAGAAEDRSDLTAYALHAARVRRSGPDERGKCCGLAGHCGPGLAKWCAEQPAGQKPRRRRQITFAVTPVITSTTANARSSSGRHVCVVSAAGWSSPGLVCLPEPVDATVGIYYRGTCCYRWL